MASTKFNVGDRVRFILNYSSLRGREATVVAEPKKYADDESYQKEYATAVWTDIHGDRITHIDESMVELVSTGDGREEWRTVTKKEKRLLKSLLNNSVEFRIQVRVKGV